MTVEKTMEFILLQQSKIEAWHARTEGQMAAIRKLIQPGMRMIVKNEEQIRELAPAQKATKVELQELASARRVAETKLQGLIDALRRRGNGSKPKK